MKIKKLNVDRDLRSDKVYYINGLNEAINDLRSL